MTKVNFVKKAAKDYPSAGIAKGEPYYWWQHFRQRRQMSKTRPKPSQVASSEYERTLLALIEGLEEWGEEPWTEEDRDSLIGDIEELRDQEQDKFDNMPEGFQQGDVGMQIEDRISALDEWVNELQSLDFSEEDAIESPLEKALSLAP